LLCDGVQRDRVKAGSSVLRLVISQRPFGEMYTVDPLVQT
jgi:hypothetical protein